MATEYPSTFPLPKVEGFTATVGSGLVKTETPTQQDQRRVFATMPHTFSLTFVVSVATWAVWQNWVLTYGYRWFEMRLPTMYAGLAESDLSPVLIRFTSDISAQNVTMTDVQITMTAESAPSMIAGYLGAV